MIKEIKKSTKIVTIVKFYCIIFYHVANVKNRKKKKSNLTENGSICINN